MKNAGARVTAIADLFPDQLQKGCQHFDALQQAMGYAPIDSSQLFKGPNAYKEIADSKEVDFILITTPPYFHTHHLETVVAAGKHVYCEKPVAVDVPNAHHVISIGEKAQGKLSLAVGFQIRNAPPMVELTKRIQSGALGKIGCGLAYYYCGHIDRPEWPNASPDEQRLRNWVWDHKLSGDIIVEQNIHVIDMCNWMLNGHPLKAVGMCDRKIRTDAGDCKDNFNVLFTYPGKCANQLRVGPVRPPDILTRRCNSSARTAVPNRTTIGASTSSARSLGCRVEAQRSCRNSPRRENSPARSTMADSEKEKAFVASITSGQFLNQAALGRGIRDERHARPQCCVFGQAPYLGRAAKIEGSVRSQNRYY